jgi:hypothetical protein
VQGLTLERSQHEQRQPSEQGDADDSSAQEREGVVGQVGSPQQLKQRAAKDKREVLFSSVSELADSRGRYAAIWSVF